MTRQTRRRLRAGLICLTGAFVLAGLWATLDPIGFYERVPGGRFSVQGGSANSAEVVGNAGFGYLGLAMMMLLAAIWTDIRMMAQGGNGRGVFTAVLNEQHEAAWSSTPPLTTPTASFDTGRDEAPARLVDQMTRASSKAAASRSFAGASTPSR